MGQIFIAKPAAIELSELVEKLPNDSKAKEQYRELMSAAGRAVPVIPTQGPINMQATDSILPEGE